MCCKVRHKFCRNNEDKIEYFKEIMSLWQTLLGYELSPLESTFTALYN